MQHQLRRGEDFADLIGHLPREDEVLDRVGQVLADAPPLALLRRARLELVAQPLKVVLELAEEGLARGGQLAKDKLTPGELLEAHATAEVSGGHAEVMQRR